MSICTVHNKFHIHIIVLTHTHTHKKKTKEIVETKIRGSKRKEKRSWWSEWDVGCAEGAELSDTIRGSGSTVPPSQRQHAGSPPIGHHPWQQPAGGSNQYRDVAGLGHQRWHRLASSHRAFRWATWVFFLLFLTSLFRKHASIMYSKHSLTHSYFHYLTSGKPWYNKNVCQWTVSE